MSTKTITGTYADGYALSSSYHGLVVAQTAQVYGPGVSSDHSAFITNLGTVDGNAGTANGISLSAGGTIVNGSASDTSATIEAASAVTASGASTAVKNFGTIKSDTVTVVKYYTYGTYGQYTEKYSVKYKGPGVSLTDGGSIKNIGAAANVTNGVSISGGSGSVVNTGMIGARQTERNDLGYTAGLSVALYDGGSVVNGSKTQTSASLSGGVLIAGTHCYVTNYGIIGDVGVSGSAVASGVRIIKNGSDGDRSATISYGISLGEGGTVINHGVIGGHKYESSDGTYGKTTASIVFEGGGDYRALTVTNGDSVDTSASIVNGISVSFGAGTITNFGTIGSPVYTHTANDKSSVKTTSAIVFDHGGTVDNKASGTIDGVSFFKIKGVVVNSGTIDSPGTYGSANSSRKDAVQLTGGGSLRNNAGGTINGVLLNSRRSSVNTIVNDGTINGATSADYTTGANVVSSVNVQVLGSVTNGSATNAQAELTDGVVISNVGTIINFGIIGESSDGMAVSLAKADSIFVEEGTGALTGDVAGGGGELILGGDAGAGTLTGLGSTITGFSKINVSPGATWTLESATVTASVVDFYVGGTATFSGTTSIATTIAGGGLVAFQSGDATLLTGAKIKTDAFTVSGSGAQLTIDASLYYTGDFTAQSTAELTLAGGAVLTLAGLAQLDQATLDGAGKLTTKGTTTASLLTLGGTASWVNYASVTETGTTALGASTSLTNVSGATFALAGNVGISADATAKIYNDGTLIKTAGTGLGTVSASIKNSGTIEVESGTLDLAAAITGAGLMTIDGGTTLELGGPVAQTQTVTFGAASGTLKLDDAKGFDATVSGFDAGDKLDVAGFVASTTSLSFIENGSGTSGMLQLTDGSATAQIFIAGNHTADGFHLGSDGAGGSLVTYATSGAVASKATVHTDPHTASLAAALFDGAFSLAIASSPLSAPPHAPSMAVLAAHS